MKLIRYDAARHALAEAKAVDEVKDLRDKAEAMRIYGMQAKNKELEVDAAEIRIRAERRLGELLAAQKDSIGLNSGARLQGSVGGAGRGESAVVSDDRRFALADVGISKDLSARAQKIAAVPEEEFEAEVGEWRDRVKAEGKRVTTRLEKAGERAKGKKPAPASEELQTELGQALDRIAELQWQCDRLSKSEADLIKIVEANDQLVTAYAEIKRLREVERILEERIRGLQNEKNAAIRQAKGFQRRAEKAERSATTH